MLDRWWRLLSVVEFSLEIIWIVISSRWPRVWNIVRSIRGRCSWWNDRVPRVLASKVISVIDLLLLLLLL